MQGLAGGWHHIGSSISEKANKSSAVKLHFFGSKMQRAPVCPRQGKVHPK